MTTKVLPLPSAQAPVAEPGSGRMDATWYRQLNSLERAVRELQQNVETLRQALNEARQNPTTAYPPISSF